jgi:hypothetical protein
MCAPYICETLGPSALNILVDDPYGARHFCVTAYLCGRFVRFVFLFKMLTKFRYFAIFQISCLLYVKAALSFSGVVDLGFVIFVYSRHFIG